MIQILCLASSSDGGRNVAHCGNGTEGSGQGLTNEYFSEYFKEDLSGFLEGTVGQKERHWLANNKSVVDLCVSAA